MKYEILQSSDRSDLVKNVMRFIKDGWHTEGGVSIAYDTSREEIIFAQAVSLYGEGED